MASRGARHAGRWTPVILMETAPASASPATDPAPPSFRFVRWGPGAPTMITLPGSRRPSCRITRPWTSIPVPKTSAMSTIESAPTSPPWCWWTRASLPWSPSRRKQIATMRSRWRGFSNSAGSSLYATARKLLADRRNVPGGVGYSGRCSLPGPENGHRRKLNCLSAGRIKSLIFQSAKALHSSRPLNGSP
jgi:hypothetical protein